MMSFNGRDYFEWNMGVIMQDISGQLYFEWLDCDPVTGDLELLLEASGWDYFIFFPAFMDVTSEDHLYEISILESSEIEGSSEIEDRFDVRVSSNPMFSGGYVTFDIPFAGHALLQVYDLNGRVAATLFEGEMQAGTHSIPFDTEDFSTGTYFVLLSTGDCMSGGRVVIAR